MSVETCHMLSLALVVFHSLGPYVWTVACRAPLGPILIPSLWDVWLFEQRFIEETTDLTS